MLHKTASRHILSPKRLISSVLIVAAALLLSGCGTLGPFATGNNASSSDKPEPNLSELAHKAARQMVSSNSDMARYQPMIAATFVNIDDLSESSTFGRISSELVASALSRQGLRVSEVKMRDSLFIDKQVGELILSRKIKRLSERYNSRSILMGTYARGEDYVYVSARVVRAQNARVLGTADFRLPLNNNIRALLGGQEGW
ncbi:FlgO family outer membrane protein [Vreelandella jeotgali]|uniref:FlgO family outer membrane protein n=1 Tax=Vreelandella jeotgali TaxID=553386 RepID=UPI00036FF19C|nr:FlgO family outer membrane protein [Halomonas jeotgali]